MNLDLSVIPENESAARADLHPLYLHLSVTDPETVAALFDSPEGRDRQELALTAPKIGILSLNPEVPSLDPLVSDIAEHKVQLQVDPRPRLLTYDEGGLATASRNGIFR